MTAWVPLAEAASHDDVLHQPGEGDDWSEHHYFFFSDAATGLAGGCRVAWRSGDGVAKGMLFAFLPDGVALWQAEGDDDRLAAGPRVLAGKPMGGWTVRFGDEALLLGDGLALSGLRADAGEMSSVSLALDLTFTPASPAVEAAPGPEAADLVARIAPRRFEQAGRYLGEVKVGSDAISWSGWGTRDHSWGNRAAQGLRQWKWCTLPLAETFCGGAGHVELDDGEIQSGWLAEDGHLVAVDAATVDYSFDESGVVPVSAVVTLSTPTGVRRAEGQVLAPLAMRVVEHGRPVLAVESLARWQVDDGTSGYGIVEYIRAE